MCDCDRCRKADIEVEKIDAEKLKESFPLLACECGCAFILISVTDKNPKIGICERCRKDVDLAGTKLVLSR